MKRIGLIAGIGPESTTEYYRGIIDAFRRLPGEPSYPEIIIYSANLTELMGILEAGDWPGLVAWLVARIEALDRAGADFVAIASNTPHIVFEEVLARSPLPLLSIVEETCRRAQGLGLKRPGLMGTKFTMDSDLYQRTFHPNGMPVVVPAPAERKIIQQKLFSEIELGIIRDETRDQLLAIARRMIEQENIDSLILGCTELPLILTTDAYGIPFLNTTAIHISGIVKYCLEE
jgi:aspartate racemase